VIRKRKNLLGRSANKAGALNDIPKKQTLGSREKWEKAHQRRAFAFVLPKKAVD